MLDLLTKIVEGVLIPLVGLLGFYLGKKKGSK